MLEISGIDLDYMNLKVLSNINIRVGEKEIVSVFGKRNSGKSALFKIIAGLIEPNKGEIFYEKKNILRKRYKNLNGQMVCIERYNGLFFGLTVKENIELGAWMIKDKFALKRKFEIVLNLIPGLKKNFNKPAIKLCNGEQMLVVIARAIFTEPRLIVIDEPTFGFYQLFADKILELIHRANKDLGITFLLMQQSMDEAIKIGDWLYEIDRGEIIKQGDRKSFEYFDCVDD